jgi:GT2 family glycosyltransferase
MTPPRTLSVVIPTYQRPTWIRRAVRSLAIQGRPPDEVIAVARDTDIPTHEAIADLQRGQLPFVLRRELVTEPGFMPPVRAGLAVAEGDVVAVMDDDAEAVEGWAERLIGNYADASVGAVGGRCINMDTEERAASVPDVDRVGYVTRWGKFVGHMYCRPTFSAPVEVDFMLGGNMSFRREVARRLEFDLELNRNVAQGYEVDIGLQVKAMGWKVLFDPGLAIRHYSAPRATIGMRPDADAAGVQWYSYNHARVTLRRLRNHRRVTALAYQIAVGERRAPGLLPMLLSPLGRRLGFETGSAAAALRGRLLAIRSVLVRPPVAEIPKR